MIGRLLVVIVAVVFLFSITVNFTGSTFASSYSPDASIKNTPQSVNKKEPFALFENPILGDGADPWVVKHSDGYYYYTHTTGRDITIWKSKTLTGLADAPKKTVYIPSDDGPHSQSIWAPEIHFIDGKWYIYFAASGNTGSHRMYVLQSEGSDPFGPYSFPDGTEYGKITDPTDKWAIDGTVLEYKNKLYFIWSGWEGDVNVSQHLYIAPMSNPWTISGERVEISRPELAWEKNGFPLINEGPQVLKNKQGKVFIIYSASGSWTNDYCLGMLSFEGANPLDASSWRKHLHPTFETNTDADVYGPGHSSFVKSPDGKEDWIVYHAAKFKDGGWTRNVRMQKFSWNKDGTPNFGKPVGTKTLLRVPSGETEGALIPSLPGEVYHYEAEDATVNNARIHINTSASGHKKVGHIDFIDSYIEFKVDVPLGDYTLVVRYGNGMGQPSSHLVTVNGQSYGEVVYESHGWENWQDAKLDIHLNSAQNTIRISKGHLYAEIDYIQVIPKETKVYKYEAEFAKLHKANIINDSFSSNGQKVGGMNQSGSFARFEISANSSGTYKMKIKYADATDAKSSHILTVNEGFNTTISHETKGENNLQETTVVIPLNEGKNVIMFNKGIGFAADIDFFTIEKIE
ncbi:family 43 glycosylhydrolase [Lederbergia wuyishanensis]|uniref:GH43 family beta-xylosidase n=1 Tax=Lederbergia wuyishanensis TaxID=1347903 RepID=A0ABU0D5F3_9BACI|nr:family 43 glycosylhydrolase [Lederbergia wuyishanensis]MCJ8009787.1 family 43 glycosylhydrolase [Lederbergia wuyishanensis]MDQ0343643.1 GH43 family beta-xylosidase [Lederbergia wuyishanensis]